MTSKDPIEGPVLILVYIHVLILIGIGWTLTVLQVFGAKRGWAYQAQSWTIEQLYLSIAYINPAEAAAMAREIEELRADRKRGADDG